MNEPAPHAAPHAEVVWPVNAILGEGVCWQAAEQRIYFVDIKKPAVHAYEPASGARFSWAMPEMTGWLVPRARGGWIAGLKSGVATLSLQRDEPELQWLHRLHDPDSPMRLNDGKADAAGHLWFGSMNDDDETRPDGALYRLAPDASLHRVDDGYCVTNGPCFSPDGRTIYHTDSVHRTIYAFDVAGDRSVSNKRVWKRIDGPEDIDGYPDGMCTDRSGFVWVARWGGGCVTRLDPDGNEVLRVPTGAARTTNCCFGGPQLTDLYLSSARIGLDASALAAMPASGALLRLANIGQGDPPHVFGG